jgi:hypothetical protein
MDHSISLIHFVGDILARMSVTSHGTPNPNAHKYVLAQWRFASARNISSADAAAGDALAETLFAIPGVYNLLMAQDFVTVNKYPDEPWDAIDAQVIAILEQFLKEQTA